jgi:hypothetical protein
MPNTVALESSLSGLRSGLIALGGVLAGRGWVSAEIVDQAVGVALIVVPAAWGAWQKISADRAAKAHAALALNVGVALADVTMGKTPAIPPAVVPAVIEAFKPVVLMPINPKSRPDVLPVPTHVIEQFVVQPPAPVMPTVRRSAAPEDWTSSRRAPGAIP